jgi:hypothetical protein
LIEFEQHHEFFRFDRDALPERPDRSRAVSSREMATDAFMKSSTVANSSELYLEDSARILSLRDPE